MKITKYTTDEELMEGVTYLRRSVLKTLTETPDNVTGESLATDANALAKAQGRVQARYEYRNALASDDITEEDVRKHLTSLLLISPDDTYSGRLNDNRRSKHEGLREEVRDLLQNLRLHFAAGIANKKEQA